MCALAASIRRFGQFILPLGAPARAPLDVSM
jgi:hypothetical protein